ncbi:hypothetical protein BpHYR1_050588 [Brachionus plicatilis]|uniref:Uncharacterized protein n=1 Tax=Brachionus plicatilis TaxID=10195 RepID=A0A3M7S3E4_BRAPC|nr:hypothetical protein BpHYR1_050588 [Brachionus plicatilis]
MNGKTLEIIDLERDLGITTFSDLKWSFQSKSAVIRVSMILKNMSPNQIYVNLAYWFNVIN